MNYLKKGIILSFTGLAVTASAMVLTQPIKFDSRTTPACVYSESYKSEVIRLLPYAEAIHNHFTGIMIYNDREKTLADLNGDGKLDMIDIGGKSFGRPGTGDSELEKMLRNTIKLNQKEEKSFEKNRLYAEKLFNRYDKEFESLKQHILRGL